MLDCGGIVVRLGLRLRSLIIPSLQSRRQFVAALFASVVTLSLPFRKAVASLPHPAPRPGVTGAKVLTAGQLSETPDLIPLFDSIRPIAGTVDGVRCNCGCPNPPDYYSLLSCFEGDAMAQICVICQSQGRLVVRLHKERKSLDQIRAAVDAKFA